MIPRRRVVDAEETARRIRESFHATKVQKKVPLPFSWPSEVQHIGRARAQLYESNKWQRDSSKTELYKHVAEAYQDCFVCPGTKIMDEDGNVFRFQGDHYEMNGDLPKHFAMLAQSLGLMVTLNSGDSVQISIPGTYWGAARHPETKEAFLVLYDKSKIYFILTGEELDVKADGIVG